MAMVAVVNFILIVVVCVVDYEIERMCVFGV